MLRFFYDSLDTVKKLRKPTKQEYINLTIAILVAIVVGSLYFVGIDSIVKSLYNIFYSVMTA